MTNSLNRTFPDKALTFVSNAFIAVFALLCFYPLILTFMVSISNENLVQIHGFKLIPEKISFDTYKYLWERASRNIINAYGITIFVTVVGTLVAMLFTSMLAFTLSQKSVRYRNSIAFLAYFTVIFAPGILPWYITCIKILNIKDTMFALIFPYTINVWNLFLLRNYFTSIPDEVIESAKIDGASSFLIFRKLAIPLSKTALLTIGMFYGIQYWNDWWLAIMLISKKALFPLQYYLFSLLTSAQALASMPSIDSGIVSVPTETIKMAVTVITIGPIIFLFPLVQKYFVKGIMVGAVKG